ncbi:MAG: patatin-like phospholipase family protein [Candidatus Delongbacteria bacterium]|nr:patatin-like phospholipase family protein [Candidatus Delongbacteria bacterium]MBN2835719.1 patatin-like phospholipase family protein [Candidatus Delongbacteria bacterium]
MYRWLFLILFLVQLSFATKTPKIGLVLSGGGAKGLAHIGVIKAIEESGLKIDYIAGTSMGGIISALYSIGYNANQLDSIARNTKWFDILKDELPRYSKSIDDRDDDVRYFVSLPIEGTTVSLPKGLISGHLLVNYLSELTIPYHNVSNFDDFPIPLRIVSTDIATGKEVVFKHGFLPQILRSTMSIPSAFNPVSIEDKLLVDGGVADNLPVEIAIDMGADIIIAVDVGAPLYSKDELNTMLRIMEQSVSLYGANKVKESRLKADILIEPNIDGYNSTSFSDADSILATGYKEGERYISIFKKLAKIQNSNNEDNDELINCDEEYKISKISYTGLDGVSRQLILSKLQIDPNDILSISEIKEAINRVYASGFFESVYYKLIENDDSYTLNIIVEEKENNAIKAGFHYDSEYEASGLFNLTIRNQLMKGSELKLDLKLSEDFGIRTSYFVQSDFSLVKLGVGLIAEYIDQDIDIYLNPADDEADISDIYLTANYQKFTNETKFMTIFMNSFQLGTGFRYQRIDYNHKNFILSSEENIRLSNSENIYSGFFNIEYDNLDRTVFARNGMKFSTEISYNKFDVERELFEGNLLNGNYLQSWLKMERRRNFLEVLTFVEKFNIGSIFWDLPPEDKLFYIGGNYSTPLNTFSLSGYKTSEFSAMSFISYMIGVEYEFYRNFFVSTNFNVVKLSDKDIINTEFEISEEEFESLYFGYSLNLSFNSLIGPITTMIEYSERRSFLFGLNIGYSFYR